MRPGERPGFLDGARALASGFGFLLRTPAAWPLALVPVVIAAVTTVAIGGGAIVLLAPRVAALFGPRWAWLAIVADVLAGVLAFIVAALVGLSVAQPLSGPALERIVRRAEAETGAPEWPATGLLEDMGRSLGSMLIPYTVGLPILLVLGLVSFLVPPAAVVTLPLKLAVLALLFAWDLCDYPLSIHGAPLAARVAFVTRNARAMVGFGVGLALFSLIPCGGLLVLPAGVAGAARLTRKIELWEGAGADGHHLPVEGT